MMQQKTPGVYVEEISKFPPSVAGVATAIPAFIGFTENGETFKPVKVSSLLDYTTKFGGSCELTIDNDGAMHGHKFVMYDSIRLFYDNGGGTCYVIPVGNYKATGFEAETYMGKNNELLTQLKKVDEITLICMPDAAMLLKQDQLNTLQKAILSHCGKMKDRFAILDPKQYENLDEAMEKFRGGTGSDSLSYGAAYYPYLKTTYTKEIKYDQMKNAPAVKEAMKKATLTDPSIMDYDKVIENVHNRYKGISDALLNKKSLLEGFLVEGLTASEILSKISTEDIPNEVIDEIRLKIEKNENYEDDINNINTKIGYVNRFSVEKDGSIALDGKSDFDSMGFDKTLKEVFNDIVDEIKATTAIRESELENNPLLVSALINQIPDYEKILAQYQAEASVITPCGAIAGIYCATDNSKGVWQAPANISIASVSDVTEMISDEEQENMNVDTTSGKSVNAIRFFTGKGILVWGARTLDGNSNEWRYVSVRRLFNYIEESVQKSTAWAVFQPNDASTWMKIQCQIENFLTSLWREGALAGATPGKAFFVNVGLGVTMTADDIYNGNLIVEIGLAAVRPAEFIILQFSHKVQE